MKRPSNHVTRQLDAMRSDHDKTPQLPVLDRAQLERLEELYPPQCLGRTETMEEHLRYAGVVEHIANLRARFEQHHEDDNEDSLEVAERA